MGRTDKGQTDDDGTVDGTDGRTEDDDGYDGTNTTGRRAEDGRPRDGRRDGRTDRQRTTAATERTRRDVFGMC